MSEALEHVRQVCAEFDRANPHWREIAETDKARKVERQKRELAEAEKQRQQARKACERQVVSADWYAAVDSRIHDHFKDWAWGAIDERIGQHIDRHNDIFKDAVAGFVARIRAQVRKEFETEIGKVREEFRVGIGRIEATRRRSDDLPVHSGNGGCHTVEEIEMTMLFAAAHESVNGRSGG